MKTDSPTHDSLPATPSVATRLEKPRVWSISVVVTVITIALSGATYGLENSLVSPLSAIPEFVKKYQGLNHATRDYTLTANHQSMIFAIPLIGTIIGAIFSSYLQNRLGRKWSLCAAYMFSIPSTQLQLWAPNLGAFIMGRLMNGLAYGCALSIGPLYLADVVPTSIRGGAVATSNLLTILANLMAAVCCWASQKNYSDSRTYKVPLAVQAGLPFLLLLPTPFLPESPVWCVQKGRIGQARMALKRVRPVSDHEIEEELQEIVRAEQERSNLSKDTKFTDIFSRKHLLRTVVAGSFFSLNQVSGVILSTTYATLFLSQLKLGTPFLFTVYAYVCQLIGAVLAIVALEKVGRRSLALPGFVMLTVIDLTAGALAFNTGGNPNVAKTIGALGMVFNFFWTLCFYSISLLMPSELPTQRLRNYTMSYAIGWGQLTAVVTTLSLPQITAADAGNLAAKAYLIFGGCMFVITILAFFLLPETRGRTFFEIDQLYANHVPAWRWSKYEFSRGLDSSERVALHLDSDSHAVGLTSVDKKDDCHINTSGSSQSKSK
ncbi:hypothetical protein NDA16_004273 [Ustilago loliicola]|nr:hypothetical protein NDA16_004273 [Ustilago loliicola]